MKSPAPPLRLICLPFAGGNRYSLAPLQQHLDSRIGFVAPELPGRGGRMAEPLLYDLRAMARDVYRQVLPFTGSPYLVYGHSMGGMLGYLLLRELQRHGDPMPKRFLASGCMAPRLNAERTIRHTLSDADFEAELVRLGGMPTEVLEHRELLQLVLPIIRADFRAVETYRYEEAPPHEVPITALRGTDEDISQEQLLGWQAETRVPLSTDTLPGGHFFIYDHLARLAALIEQEMPDARVSEPYPA